MTSQEWKDLWGKHAVRQIESENGGDSSYEDSDFEAVKQSDFSVNVTP